ncbi:hypothetical protein ACH5RR_036315 [Cinchona calisaya]|uniref:NHL repeat-containing protein n=1 Tax=Cinchona calisaya TaxID=153742 RepID=A0ABD2Y578_9GENT
MLFTSKNATVLLPLLSIGFLFFTSVFFTFVFFVGPTSARKPHIINFRSHNLFPESFTWDPKAQHFIVGSLRYPTLLSVSDAGVVETLVSDSSLPSNSSFVGLSLDRQRRRILACVHRPSSPSSPAFNALAAYDLSSGRRLFLSPLLNTPAENPDAGESSSSPSPSPSDVANDVAVDYSGNAYVTNSGADIIWKINVDGEASVLSRSNVFKSFPVDQTAWYRKCGLNGVVYNSKGYLLVVQSNTGKLYKVDVDDGTSRRVILNKDLTAGDGLAVRSDGVLVVVSQEKLYFVRSQDSWSEGVVFDETALEAEKQASGVTVGEEDRVYVLYGYVNEGVMGNVERDEFSVIEVESEIESEGEKVWLYVLIGLGLAYFLFWRFQMKQLVHNMNKKTN